jgi:transposase-like protein
MSGIPELDAETLKESYDVWRKHGENYATASKELGVARSTLQNRVKQYKKRHGMADNETIKGRSLLVDRRTDTPVLEWVKTNVSAEEQKRLTKLAIDALLEQVEPLGAVEFQTTNYNTDVIPWFQIGDGHLGMVAYHREVGHNFDLKIAERELCKAMATLIEETPACERCVIQDCGDMSHYENYAAVTEASGHALDFDGRFDKMIRVYVRVMRYIVDTALRRFRHVDVIINQGNHSRTNDIWMRQLLLAAYAGNERLTVLDNSSVFIPYRMGNTFVMCHHGDKCKPDKLAGVMANDFRQDWGEAEYRYIDAGHVHHRKTAVELSGVVYESWNQLAAPDKYAHDGGWRSRQCLSVVERSKTYGQVGRRTIPIARVKDMLDKCEPGMNAQVRRVVHTV